MTWRRISLNKREQYVNELTVEDVQQLAKQYIDPDKMFFLVVGDAATQLEKLEGLGYGEPILINEK
jgi:zinc protease